MTLVKICGLTDPAHVRAAEGAHALGFVVESPRSRRDLDLDAAAALARLALPFQATVAVTAAQEPDALHRIARRVQPHALQAPLAAGASAFEGLRKEFPAMRLLAACRPEDAPLAPAAVDALVLDALSPDGYGGHARTLDWANARAARDASAKPVLLAGGLTPANVQEAIRAVRPYAVDVSSGVETAGAKDPERMRAFVEAVRRCDP